VINRAFPVAVQLLRAATVHRDAARRLLEQCPANAWSFLGHEVIYLGGYVVECSLKAVVVSKSPPSRHEDLLVDFKTEVKHNLDSLRVRLSRKRIELPKAELRALSAVRSLWDVEMRYDAIRRKRSDAEGFLQQAEIIYSWAGRN
jgi:hypothetical protein